MEDKNVRKLGDTAIRILGKPRKTKDDITILIGATLEACKFQPKDTIDEALRKIGIGEQEWRDKIMQERKIWIQYAIDLAIKR